MLKRPINWSSIGEWAFIFSFCICYGFIANVQSRLFPVENSMAFETRKRVDFEVNRLKQKHYCEDQAVDFHNSKDQPIWIWYENKNTNEYWCGLLYLDRLTVERARELAPHVEVLNSDRGIRRIIENESDKHISGRKNLP